MARKLLNGIKPLYVMIPFIAVVVWTLCSCLFVECNTSLVMSLMNQTSDSSILILRYLILIAVWCSVEYILDISADALFAHVDSVTFSRGFDDIYNTKPEVLKNVNAGYVTGLMRTLQSKRSDLIFFMVTEFIMAIVYVSYFAIRLSEYHWIFSVILLFIVIFGTAIRVVGRRMVMSFTHRLIEADSVVTKTFIDISTNIGTVQKMQANKFMKDKLDTSLSEYRKSKVKNTEANDIFYVIFKFIVYTFAPVCLIITNTYNFGFDKIEFYALVSPLSVQLVHMAKCIASFFKRCDLFISAQSKVDCIVNTDTMNTSKLINSFNTITLNDVDYTYKHNVTKNTVHIQIPSMTIERGDKVCIYGESGQGKTTTLNVLSRQLETDCVFVDGNRTMNRINCVFISQDTEIFDMSVRDNLTLGNPEISDAELISMMDSVGLGEWLMSQDDGLNTLLGERGVFVSTGQRQRLNLIRGLLIQDKDLYLLDEPTSNVDECTEKKMVDLISSKLEDKTFIIVSHRKAIAGICNRFYKFENGVCGNSESTFDA